MDGTTAVTDWTVTATPPSVDLAVDGTATVTLEVKIPTDTAALAPSLKIDLSSTAAAVSASSAFTVANQYTITIPDGTGAGAPHAGLPAINAPIRLRMGAKLIFHNGDGISHQIHAAGGFPHENGALASGNDYTVTPTDSATWYCHLHEGGDQNRPVLIVQ